MKQENNKQDIQKLKQEIEQMRVKLHKIADKKEKFTQEEVINISQQLDELLNQLYKNLH